MTERSELERQPQGLPPAALLERGDQPGLIFEPRVFRKNPTTFELVGKRDNETVIPWGFWGGMLAIAISLVVFAYEGLTGLWAIWDMLGALAGVTVGLLLMRFGARSSLTTEPCAEIDLEQRTIRLLSSTDGLALPETRIDDLVEIVFGMTKYPVSRERGAVKVDAYSLLVRHQSNTLIPIVEASPDKEALYGAAQFLSRATRLPITQVGIGIK